MFRGRAGCKKPEAVVSIVRWRPDIGVEAAWVVSENIEYPAPCQPRLGLCPAQHLVMHRCTAINRMYGLWNDNTVYRCIGKYRGVPPAGLSASDCDNNNINVYLAKYEFHCYCSVVLCKLNSKWYIKFNWVYYVS